MSLLTLDEQKTAMRRRLRAHRRMLEASLPDAGEGALRTYQQRFGGAPQSVALYNRQGSEFDPAALADWFATQGALIALPVIVAEGQPLVFQRLGDILEPDALFGIHQPLAHEPLVDPDVIFVPLLGFDLTGARLGQGGGFYDRTLAVQRRRRPPPLVIGLAYAGQAVDAVPTDAFDQRLDGVLTESAYVDFTGGP